jgi:hypothetical protein
MKIPVDVLRAAWIAGTLERRRLMPKDDPSRRIWKTPEELWTSEEGVYAESMEAVARVILEYASSRPAAKK